MEGPYGYVDDIWLGAFVAHQVHLEAGADDILMSRWDGEGMIIPLIEEILYAGLRLVGDKERLILDYIGYKELTLTGGRF